MNSEHFIEYTISISGVGWIKKVNINIESIDVQVKIIRRLTS